MSKTNTSSPAFPSDFRKHGADSDYCDFGLTKREYFAAMAMGAIFHSCIVGKQLDGTPHTPQTIAIECVKTADALLAELEKKP